MPLKIIGLSLGLALVGGHIAMAHDDHHHEPAPGISEEKAKVRAKEEVDRLASVKEIDPSWKDAGRLTAIEKKTYGHNWEWRATFQNDKLKEKNVLYVFLKPMGEFVAANHTGK
jgi:hypothetical protein